MSQESCAKCDFPPESVKYRWTIKNECREDIDLAVHYQNEFARRSVGWWNLDKDESITFTSFNRHVAYYAKSDSHIWSADSETGLPVFININRKFDYEFEEVPAGADITAYFRIKDYVNDSVTRVTCNNN